MSQDSFARNLESLRAEFRERGKAARGYATLDELIARKELNGIDHLLRSHETQGVYGDELVKRFEVDTLIEYYNLLLVAVFAGYVSPRMNSEEQQEITRILGCQAVMPYYQHRYPYRMTEFTLAYANSKMNYQQQGSAVTLTVLNDFISLNRYLKSDKDLERFMGMLDYVSYGDDDLDDLLDALSSFEKLSASLTRKDKSQADRAVMGFLKYSTFISQLKVLLETVEDYPLLQSSLWLYHGYYLDRMNEEMKRTMRVAFDNLARTLSDEQVFADILSELTGNSVTEEISASDMKAFADTVITTARNDMEVVLDKKWGNALNDYFSKN